MIQAGSEKVLPVFLPVRVCLLTLMPVASTTKDENPPLPPLPKGATKVTIGFSPLF